MGLGGGTMSGNIPSEEDFARASAAMKKRSRGLSEIREFVLRHFEASGSLHEFFILDCSDQTFHAYVFYPQDKDIAKASASGLEAEVKKIVFDALDFVGRGYRSVSDVEFELDSHENVVRNFGGNYFDRLH
jgi:hypothetical protein